MTATEVVAAAKAGNSADLANAQTKWKTNATHIADFLSGANPNWNKPDLEDMLFKHLDYTTDEVTAILSKNWAAGIDAYDKGEKHMLMFADVLSNGIIKQFPKKFKK